MSQSEQITDMEKEKEQEKEEEDYCDIEGCKNKLPYGYCRACEDFAICGNQDAKHRMALLYNNEECYEHTKGGYSICIPCALQAFKDKVNGEFVVGEEHCLCPICNYDFGLLSDLLWSPRVE